MVIFPDFAHIYYISWYVTYCKLLKFSKYSCQTITYNSVGFIDN